MAPDAVNLGADRMAGAMEKVLAETSRIDMASRRVVDLEAPQLPLRLERRLDHFDGAIARIADHREYLLDLRRRLIAAKTQPRDVVETASGRSSLAHMSISTTSPLLISAEASCLGS